MFENVVDDFLIYTLQRKQRLEKEKEIIAKVIKESDIE